MPRWRSRLATSWTTSDGLIDEGQMVLHSPHSMHSRDPGSGPVGSAAESGQPVDTAAITR